MLHIDIEERLGIGLVFTLKGELSGAHAFELVARWKEVRRNCHGKVCVVDLSAVGEMDDAGQEQFAPSPTTVCASLRAAQCWAP